MISPCSILFMMDDDNGFGRNVLPEKLSDNSSCLVGNPAIGFTIL